MNYYKHHIGDYRSDTAHLSLLEHGIYRQLLDMYYLSEQPIPKETDLLMRRLCARTDEETKLVKLVLQEFFFEMVDGWHHRRCDQEITEYHAKADVARENGKTGGRPKKPRITQPVPDRNPEITGSKANHKPLTINQEPFKPLSLTLPDWLPVQPWNDYVKHRGSKFTHRAKELAIIQLGKMVESGHDPTEILQTSIANGWKGIFEPKSKGIGYVNNRDRERAETIAVLTGRSGNTYEAG